MEYSGHQHIYEYCEAKVVGGGTQWEWVLVSSVHGSKGEKETRLQFCGGQSKIQVFK